MDALFGAKEGEVLSVFAALVSVALLPAAGTVGHHRAERTALRSGGRSGLCRQNLSNLNEGFVNQLRR